MQRCPYIHEMRERLLDQPRETPQLENMERATLLDNRQSASESNQVGTVVKLQGDGYHTSPAHQRTPLVPHDLGEDFNLDFDDDFPIDARRPKNAKVCYTFKPNPNKFSFMPAKITVQGTYETNPITGPIELWTSLFIVTSLVYAILLIVVCIAYVISDVTTHRLPVLYYETFFTYLYGVSILFLLYVFCFLLQESSCCNGGNGGSKPKPQPKEKKSKKAKNADPADSKEAKGSKDSGKAAKGAAYQHTMAKFLEAPVDAEVAVTPKNVRKRKTTHSDLTHGSFFLRVGAIAFGLGAMIYIGLEFGSFFEIPFDSPCHHILIGVNPLLQMIFTFMQMYFIFMNARLNIHRFKVIARFGLMHVVATNICVWIRTLVKESLLEITIYHQKHEPEAGASSIAHSIRQHALRHAGTVLRTHAGPNSEFEVLDGEDLLPKDGYKGDNVLSKLVRNTVNGISKSLGMGGDQVVASTTTTTTRAPFTTPNYQWHSTTMARKLKKFITSATTAATTAAGSSSSTSSTTISPTTSSTTIPPTTSSTTISPSTTFNPFSTTAALNLETSGSDSPFGGLQRVLSSAAPPSLAPVDGFGSAATPTPVSGPGSFVDSFLASTLSPASSTEGSASIMNNLFGQGPMENSFQTYTDLGHEEATGLVSFENLESLDNIYPAALSSNIGTLNSTACGRIDIMGTIVYDSAPYLYPFIIEYSLIGAVVLYVMWKHIGRYPGRMNDEDLEHRLEVMLSRRAVAMAQQARSGRVDCVGSSKGLFFGLLLLVGALICLILFFVLVRHQQFSLLAIYLADASHCILMAFAILAIIVGFIRVKNLKFRCEEQSNLNDILLRISAFGLFTYSVFSIIAGSLKVLESEPSLLVTTTGGVAVFQVILQLLFIADVSRRRVHLPEHDRSKPGRQIVTFLLICNVAMFAIYTFEAQKVFANPVSRYVQLEFYGFVPWSIIQRITLPLCIFHRFHSAVTLAEIWKTTYKARLE
ncbi:proton channel OtopLc isoform X1 [Drosophila subpulchrella]|uniref:proton channel OtopLc isoform X1 n=1 Tax=Drosophila subpulchrella TaxID=1486046 RepID=UPI0018A14F15|nr:proton channel OtopLc isoform X1 [Drosophila subpulchrella]XP_037723997.1 proton channel OtopLc isoform X1 [Drosophila subpulchrella]XP_037723998.1 proton channel OtopLc isoform X1 [Drosophila subpulchrella]XP_037723999.1 proton channel OtopLc isoform X1 [Drosophila subpulchrella]XP_037724000.1 proton channel OtopLc isoform X1 [Drosophila subpulchrella]